VAYLCRLCRRAGAAVATYVLARRIVLSKVIRAGFRCLLHGFISVSTVATLAARPLLFLDPFPAAAELDQIAFAIASALPAECPCASSNTITLPRCEIDAPRGDSFAARRAPLGRLRFPSHSPGALCGRAVKSKWGRPGVRDEAQIDELQCTQAAVCMPRLILALIIHVACRDQARCRREPVVTRVARLLVEQGSARPSASHHQIPYRSLHSQPGFSLKGLRPALTLHSVLDTNRLPLGTRSSYTLPTLPTRSTPHTNPLVIYSFSSRWRTGSTTPTWRSHAPSWASTSASKDLVMYVVVCSGCKTLLISLTAQGTQGKLLLYRVSRRLGYLLRNGLYHLCQLYIPIPMMVEHR
jgi:hypothetical protein